MCYQIAMSAVTHNSPPSRAALRMRYSRERRRLGLRTARIDLQQCEIIRLVTLGYVALADATNAEALGAGLSALLDQLPPPERWPPARR